MIVCLFVCLLAGGVRSAAFVSGGLVGKSVRGTVYTGIVSITDHATTLLDLAGLSASAMGGSLGHDTQDVHGDVPPLDGVSLWPVISGRWCFLEWSCALCSPAFDPHQPLLTHTHTHTHTHTIRHQLCDTNNYHHHHHYRHTHNIHTAAANTGKYSLNLLLNSTVPQRCQPHLW
jgi:hypothetical protein